MENMTARVSCFARVFHFKNNVEWVFKDNAADKIITETEYNVIAMNMTKGINYFAPDFRGSEDEALRFIVDHNLSPTVLIRSAFCERAFENEEALGCRQYVLFAGGYDLFAVRCKKEINVFELDKAALIEDKKSRISNNGFAMICNVSYVACDLSDEGWSDSLGDRGFKSDERAFGSLLGISYYLPKEAFKKLISRISKLWSKGSAICFDYPVYENGEEFNKNQELAAAANEPMQAKYSYKEMEILLQECGFLISEDYDSQDATREFCEKYNANNPKHKIVAPIGVRYCLAIKNEE